MQKKNVNIYSEFEWNIINFLCNSKEICIYWCQAKLSTDFSSLFWFKLKMCYQIRTCGEIDQPLNYEIAFFLNYVPLHSGFFPLYDLWMIAGNFRINFLSLCNLLVWIYSDSEIGFNIRSDFKLPGFSWWWCCL